MTPNYELLYKSAVFALQDTYRQYKKAINNCLKWTFIDDSGNFCILAGYEERNAKVEELSREIVRLQFKVKELKEVKGYEFDTFRFN